MKLTKDNYYSQEANRRYMSVSQIKNFADCEARAMAELEADYDEAPNKAMVVGNYVHTAFDGDEEFEKFVEENSGIIFNTKGNKYADFAKADEMIETLKNDELSMFALSGETERIYTANIFGHDFKCKVDSVNDDKRFFSDIKTTAQLDKRMWSDKYNAMVSFVEKYDYVLQMYLYREIIHANTNEYYEPYIVAVTKEDTPNKAVIHIDEERYVFEAEYAQNLIDRVASLKSGEADPVGCGNCKYCRTVKKLEGTIEVAELLNK